MKTMRRRLALMAGLFVLASLAAMTVAHSGAWPEDTFGNRLAMGCALCLAG